MVREVRTATSARSRPSPPGWSPSKSIEAVPGVDPSFLLDLGQSADDGDPVEVLEGLPMERRREVVRAVVDQVDVGPAGRQGEAVDPARIAVRFVGEPEPSGAPARMEALT